MPKIAIVSVSLFAALVIVLLFTFGRGETAQQTIRSDNDPSGNALINRVGSEGDRDLLLAMKAQLSSMETRLQVLEQRPPTPPPGLPSVPATSPAAPPLQLPDGSDAPWAWIENLDPLKQAAVEKAFDDAASSFRGGFPGPSSPDDAELEASMAKFEQDVTRRLGLILSPQEFEAYLLSLPDDALERLGFEKSGN